MWTEKREPEQTPPRAEAGTAEERTSNNGRQATLEAFLFWTGAVGVFGATLFILAYDDVGPTREFFNVAPLTAFIGLLALMPAGVFYVAQRMWARRHASVPPALDVAP